MVMYTWAYEFALDSKAGQKSITTECAIQLWRMVYRQEQLPDIFERWVAFLEAKPGIKSITKDTWNMFPEFGEIGTNLSHYDHEQAWPSVFDDFVDYEKDRLGSNFSKDDSP